MNQRLNLFCFLLLVLNQGNLFGQGINTQFGQNRLQHTPMQWSFLRSENFDTYFYSGGREIATFAAKYAEENLNNLEAILDHRLSGRVEIICYNTLGDFKQGNFGLIDIAQNTGGYTQVVNNKIYVYFNGDHEELAEQIKDGLSLVLLNELLYGGNFQDRIQNAALLNLPQWYLRGLTNFLSREWDADMDNRMKDAIISKKYKKFNRLNQHDPVFAGHSFWKFLTEKYEPQVISQLVYITRLTRNYESALIYITSQRFKSLQKEWYTYYQELYTKEENMRTLPINELKIKRRLAQYIQPQLKVSSKGDYVAFVTNKIGKYKVWLLNTKTGKYKKILKGGLKYNQLKIDNSFPLIAWQPGSDKIGMIYERKGVAKLKTLDLKNKEKLTIQFLKFDKITGFDFSDNGRTIALSATRRGQSDIYTYDINTRKERQLTRDFYDDKNPKFVDYSGKIIFSSNRNSDSLGTYVKSTIEPDNNYDVYLYDFETNSQKLQRLSKSANINETEPIDYTNKYYAYITDYNGIKNRYAARIEEQYDYTGLFINYQDSLEKPADTLIFEDEPTWNGIEFTYNNKLIKLDNTVKSIDTVVYYKDVVYTYPLTNYSRNILAHDVAKQTRQVYDLVQYQNKYYVKVTPVEKLIEETGRKTETYPTMFRLKSGYANKQFTPGAAVFGKRVLFEPNQIQDESNKVATPEKVLIDSNAYFFITDFTDSDFKRPKILIVPKLGSSLNSKKNIKLAAPRFYDLTFFADQVVTQLDNSIINTYYQPISGAASQMFNPGLNGMFKLGMIDLMEDYRITGGIRLAFDASGLDYFVSFENLKKILDQKFMYYRQVRSGGSAEFTSIKNISQELRYILKYPFNPASSLRFNVFYRQDREIYKATNQNTIEIPDNYTNWVGGKLEYVYDNTIPKGLNLYNGTRLKLFWEHYRNWNNKDIQLNAIGFDIRHYEKIHRQIIWATRFTANHSFGDAKVVYYLGGVENWLTPRFNNEFSISSEENYVFQALACNLRGFEQNIRNGNTFTVINTEFRIPIFQYAFNHPMRSEFLHNFQLLPFFDIGSAWVGNNPYSDNNTFNQKIIEQGSIKAKVINVRDPLVAGFGGGLRTKIIGYFIRFDVAWGIQDGEVNKKPVYYLSMALDF